MLFVIPLRSRTLCDLIDAPIVCTLAAHFSARCMHDAPPLVVVSNGNPFARKGQAFPHHAWRARRRARRSRATRDARAALDDCVKYARSVDIECQMRVQHHA